MLLSRKLDDKEIQLKNQSQIFFQISGAGHEAVLVAAGLTLKPGYDWFFPVLSRSRAVSASRRDAARHAARGRRRERRSELAAAGRCRRTGDTPRCNIVSGSSPTGTQVLHAVGAAEAGVIYSRVPQIPDRESRFHADEITYVSLGEGATSEGEFWEALNAACTQAAAGAVPRRGQRLRDLGAGRSADAGRRHLAPRAIVSRACTSTRSTAPISSPASRAMREATAYVRARKGPAFVHARVIRPYSHSLSDDEKLYKPPAEREAEARRDPIVRFAEFLQDRTASRPTTSWRDRRRRRARGERGGAEGARRAEAAEEQRRAVALLAGRRSDVRRVRDAGAARGQARHDGRARSIAR